MSETPKRILVDTNVWFDYFIPSRRGRSVAIEFLRDACTAQVDLLYAATSSKDLFYLISSEHKAWYRREHGSLSQYAATAATSLAWDCLSVLSQLATPEPLDAASPPFGQSAVQFQRRDQKVSAFSFHGTLAQTAGSR